jgi:drug/metabolite transporter (DMT)-like permease
MNWLILALAAPALYAISVFIDKYVVEHKVKDSRGVPFYGATAAGIFGTLLWLASGMPTLELKPTLILMASGLFSITAMAFYFYALSKSHASYINAMFQLIPIFILILAVVLIGERLNAMQLAGFFIVFAAVVGLSIEKDDARIRFNKAFFAMIASSFFFASASVMIKFAGEFDNFAALLVYEAWGLALGGVVLFGVYKTGRRAFLQSFKSVGRSTLAVMFSNEALFILSKALTFLAISLGPVALVGVLGGTQVFYGFLYGVVLTLLLPTIFKEDLSEKTLVKNILLAIVLLSGVWLVGVS